MRINRKASKKIITGLFYCSVIFVFILPLIRLLIMSFTIGDGIGLNHYRELLHEERTMNSIKNTIFIAIGATLVSVIAGGILAFLLAYTNIKRKKTIEVFILSQFIIPSYIITLAWSNLLQAKGSINQIMMYLHLPMFNIYSIPGIIFILGLCNTPLVYMITLHMLRKIPRDLEWAARVSGYSQWQSMIKINLVQALPALVSGGILSFLSAMDNFSVPAFLGISSNIPVLSTYIYEKAIGFGPSAFSQAAALSVILSIIAITGTIFQGSFVRKSSSMDSIKEDASLRVVLQHKTRRIVEWVVLLIFAFINIVPLTSMIITSFQKFFGGKLLISNMTIRNYAFVFSNRGVRTAAFNSLALALITCIICIVIGTIIAYMKVRKNSKSVKLVEIGASLTYGVPGIVLALAMIFHWARVPNVYGTIRILMISYITRYLVLQIKGSTTATLSVEPSLEEASAISGSSLYRTWREIIIPLISKQVLVSSFFIFISSMTELTLSSMLAAAGTRTIGLTVFNLQQAGTYNISAALSVIIVAFILTGYLVSVLIQKLSIAAIYKKLKTPKVFTEKIKKPCFEER
ncbi:ABC-type Fe3 transport system, permease component [Clostridium aceticum]|uniref:ABC-type Fe3 transport system, permease component n=1 Tax=Clostridium aceticum TaxID=84022 RepID=A0A0G3WHA5_9CLOT|nr:iron ABC transporter permease [Clostridium aceticum]AKL97277.1 ABC-type Fe3 transport system, permease component [Clostridium aceticum]